MANGQQVSLVYLPLSKEHFDDPHLVYVNEILRTIYEGINKLAGRHGPTQLINGVEATFVTSNGAKWSAGKGSPNGIVTGNVGDLYTRLDGAAGATLYVKETLSGKPTGWVAK